MIRNIVQKLYWKYNDIGNIDDRFSIETTDSLFFGLSKDDLFYEYLKHLIANDKEQYLKAMNDEQRYFIRGQISRTMSMIKRIDKAEEDSKKTKIKLPKIKGRYAV